MRVKLLVCVAGIATMMPAAAWADDPRDPAMRSAAARARDHEMIRRLNLRESAMVRKRDARYARENHHDAAVDHSANVPAGNDEYAARLEAHRRDMENYSRDRARYEQDMAEWRRAEAACRAGDYSACDN